MIYPVSPEADRNGTTDVSRRRLIVGGIAGAAIALPASAALGSNGINGGTSAVLVADRWSRALEIGSYDDVAACYTPDFEIWNNIRRTYITGAEHLISLRVALFANYSERKYVDARSYAIDGGLVRQHRLTAIRKGAAIDMPICFVCQVRGDLLMRIDEYLTPPPA